MALEEVTFLYTDNLHNIIDDISGPVADALLKAQGDRFVKNPFKIELVDVSKDHSRFMVTFKGHKQNMKIKAFVNSILPNSFSDKQIWDFIQEYNKLALGRKPQEIDTPSFNKIEPREFKFEPKDVRNTFISLVTETYPHGQEEEVMKFMPQGLTKDEFGNYYKVIGKSETMFTSHLDTADRTKSYVNLLSVQKDGDEIIMTDGTSILGADDKAGVTVMLYMMAHNVPGVYYFFIGEERGGIGSYKLAAAYNKYEHLKDLKRCVSFDRRNYFSVITRQSYRQCCSDEFAKALAGELNKSGLNISLDPTGIYTDSASFIDEIPECTNISVGYFSEHTTKECQNISFLERLAKACVSVNWESLPTVKKVGFDEEILRKYKGFLTELKATVFNLEMKMVDDFGDAVIKIEVEPDLEMVYDELKLIHQLLNKYKMNPDITFDNQYIKIILK